MTKIHLTWKLYYCTYNKTENIGNVNSTWHLQRHSTRHAICHRNSRKRAEYYTDGILQRWMAMEMRWNRNEVSLLSPEVADKRLPSLDRNWTPFTQIGPKVSKASGQKMYLWVISMYFDSFFEAASSAAPPTVKEVDRIYEAANVSATVTSHMSALPWHQGTRVIPSGLFPSERAKPDSSLQAGICAEFNARQTMPFSCWWRDILPELRRQARPCEPCEVTIVPQLHLWGSQMSIPSLSPTEIRTDSLSNRRPHDEIGSEWSQSPLCGALVASNLARLCWSLSEISSTCFFSLLYAWFIPGTLPRGVRYNRSICWKSGRPTR